MKSDLCARDFCDRLSNCVGKVEWVGPLLARLAVGVVFIQAGWGKLHNLEKTTAYFVDLGIPAASLQAPFVAGVEFVGGLMVLIGLLTRVVSVPLAFTMVVAIATAKRADIHGVTDIVGFDEFAYFAIFVWLVVSGGGKASVDYILCRRCEKRGG